MEIVLSADDFRRLSPATQREVLALLSGTDAVLLRDEHGEAPEICSLPDIFVTPDRDTAEDNVGRKLVIGITAENARDLLANLAEKSQQTLRLFAIAGYVAVDELIGDDRLYRDMNDLKRSFVGAVNRRLRTVVGNRSAVLFSSDRDRLRIRILPMAAAALRQAMGVPEPEIGDAFDSGDSDNYHSDWHPEIETNIPAE